jgi:hypothetical protein
MDQSGNAPSGGLIRSMIDALRRTPGFRDESSADDGVPSDSGSEDDSEHQSQPDSPDPNELTGDDQSRVDPREIRYARETGSGLQASSGGGNNPRRTLSQNGPSTDPRVQTPSFALMSAKLDVPVYEQDHELTQNGFSTDPRGFSQGFAPTFSPQFAFPHSSELGLEGRALSSPAPEAYQQRGNYSVRKSLGDPSNVTVRDTRRPKERQRDKDYRRLTLTSSNGFPIARVLPVSPGVPLRTTSAVPANSSPVPVPSPVLGRGASPQNDRVFEIVLIYNG